MANTTSTAPKTDPSQQYSGYWYIAAWIIVIGLFIVIARFRIGYTILMFFTLASIIIVLAVGSPTIVTIFGNAPLVGSTNISFKPH